MPTSTTIPPPGPPHGLGAAFGGYYTHIWEAMPD